MTAKEIMLAIVKMDLDGINAETAKKVIRAANKQDISLRVIGKTGRGREVILEIKDMAKFKLEEYEYTLFVNASSPCFHGNHRMCYDQKEARELFNRAIMMIHGIKGGVKIAQTRKTSDILAAIELYKEGTCSFKEALTL